MAILAPIQHIMDTKDRIKQIHGYKRQNKTDHGGPEDDTTAVC